MSLSRPLVAILGVGILGIAGVGLGAGATFTDSTHSLQTITASGMDVMLSSPTINNGAPAKTLDFGGFAPTSSTFKTAPAVIRITSKGDIPFSKVYFGASVAPLGTPTQADNQLMKQTYVCIYSPATGKIYNGTVWNLSILKGAAGVPAGIEAPPLTRSYTVEYYAGAADTQCGYSSDLASPSLTNLVSGGSMTSGIDITYVG